MTTGAEPGGALTLGKIVRDTLPAFSETHRLPAHHWVVLRAIAACRTAVLGGHWYVCENCGKDHFVPHSCRNRHCPTCQGINGADWLERQAQGLLPIPYFHIVFTIPHDLNALVQHNQQCLYDLLFASASQTLLQFGRNELQAQLGITAVLHTWGQTLCDHYHLHCILTGGGLSLQGSTWVAVRPHWLFPVRALSLVFRAKFRDGLHALFETGKLKFPVAQQCLSKPSAFASWLRRCCRRRWVVYAKRPFAGPKTVLAYLCRYTHRVGLTNRRLVSFDRGAETVSFGYKDYADGNSHKTVTLASDEFLRRFCLHILPPRFVKIRHYGLLSNRIRDARVAQARELLASTPAPLEQPLQTIEALPFLEPKPLLCPHCGKPTLKLVAITHSPTSHMPRVDDTS